MIQNNLKINYIKFIEGILLLIFLVLLVHFGQFTVILSSIATVFLLILYLNKKNRRILSSKWEYVYIFFLFILFVIESLYTSLNFNFIFYNYGIVFLILLIFPLYEVICTNKWDFFAKLNKIGIFVFFIKTVIWGAFNLLNKDLGFGGRINWARSILGHTFFRMNGTFLDSFLFSYALFKCLTTDNQKKNEFLVEVIFLFLFSIFIYQSRAQIIYYLISLLVGCLFFYSKKSNSVVNAVMFLMILLVFGFIFRNQISDFWNSFSLNSETYGGSTYVRMQEYTYFPSLWKKSNLLLGFGFFDDSNPILFNNTRLYLSDVGILMQLYQFGILGFIIDIMPLIKGLNYFVTIWLKDFSKFDLFLIIFTAYVLVSYSNFNPYLNINFPILPLYISTLLYRTSIYFNDTYIENSNHVLFNE
ncbi:hypothetical protein [Lactobacillus amylovorus]|uniref:hypothetical protein n=1 Tax=Lactobacillus amylovorus TaxID=1604 RepID=UPI002330370E|nr:hypothetical protein [Lactobacillus amylovorus]MDB6270029.1 hypothetical protein [Lactobacillus amylovorus]